MRVFILVPAVLMLGGPPFRVASEEQNADPIIVLAANAAATTDLGQHPKRSVSESQGDGSETC